MSRGMQETQALIWFSVMILLQIYYLIMFYFINYYQSFFFLYIPNNAEKSYSKEPDNANFPKKVVLKSCYLCENG